MSKVVLGKGLDALIPSAPSKQAEDLDGAYVMVPIDRIKPNPMQPRKEFSDEALGELAASLKKDGVMQPLLVRKDGTEFTIVAGERRFRAAKKAGLDKLPVILRNDLDDTQMLELALVENLQREDLNPIECAEAYRTLMDTCDLNQEQVAARVGKSRAAVANQMRLLTLPESIKRLVRENKLSEGHARALLALGSEKEMLEMADRIQHLNLSVRSVEKETESKRKRKNGVAARPDPALAEVETFLKQKLGTSVKVHHRAKKGRIEIEYYGVDDLERLLEMFRAIG